ncbi:MAG: hypothetical protein IJQ32_08555 [Paludibacteraceae bacterium]|nr:hypothetical protein [Paludibacteraceae bacterium]MBR0196273.1 hypothetical protein [Paludibacteraceae bacterium]
MSKGNMLLGQARGKVGSLVFSRQNGKQVTRAKAESIRNPQTEKQIVQRIILNTISQAYSRMAAITDHSFEGKSNPSENMAAFMKRNMNELRSKISKAVDAGSSFEEITNFAPIGTANFVYNPLVISMGALPKIPVISVTSGTGAKTGAITANTYQAVINAFNLQRGDQLTFVNIVEDAQGNKYFYYARVILNPVDAEGNNLPLTTAFINQGAIVSPSPKNEGQFAALSFDTTGITFAVGNTSVKAAAIIVSREKGDGSYARSEATLDLDENAIDESIDMCTLQDAIDQFQENDVGLDNSKYLNNASSKGSAATTPAGLAEIVSAAINNAAWDANKPSQEGVRTYSGTTSGNTKGMSAALVEGSSEPAVGSTKTVWNSGAITNGAFSFQNTEPEVGESKRVFLVVGKVSGSSIKVEAAWPYYAVLTVGD